MKASTLLTVLAVGFPAAAAVPSSEEESGLVFALRAGYGIPLGDFAGKSDGSTGRLSDEFSGVIPIWLDLGYRFERNFIVAGFLQFGIPLLNKDGPGLVGTECHVAGVSSCSGNISLRAGVEFIYVFLRDGSLQPWAGIGAAYERTIYKLEDGQGGEATISYSGWEFLNLQVGANYKLSSKFGIGPYVAISLAQYGSVDISSGNQSQTTDIANKKLHQWLQFGLMGAFDF
jgi:hypothetical protein